MKRKKQNVKFIGILIAFILLAGAFLYFFFGRTLFWKSPQERLLEYMNHISNKEYEKMYDMLYTVSRERISKEDFVKRNSAIYDGIEMENMEIEITDYNKKQLSVSYVTSFMTAAGEVCFANTAHFYQGKDSYELIWEDNLIFPGLQSTDKVRVITTEAERGRILERNNRVLAGPKMVTTVGIVLEKMTDKEIAIAKMAELLEMDAKDIESKLEASWVEKDSFVPITNIPKLETIDFMKENAEEEFAREKYRQDRLLVIPGVMLSDTKIRGYELGEAAAHLVGYVQNVTAEDLEKHKGEGYTKSSVIGRTGMESLFEKELKGQNGCTIKIVDEEGQTKEIIAEITEEDGKDIKLTIDFKLQKLLYEQFQEDKGCSVALHPKTGEVLALVSTPSYDNNAFIKGLSNEEWEQLNSDEKKPMLNRFRQIWCPGSSFKPITASIGLETGAFTADENFGQEGLSWQKDSSWGSYEVTTLHTYSPVVLKNALIYSDNIYFAKAALKIGADSFVKELTKLGFGQQLPFDILMDKSQYSNTEKIEAEVLLADSGYGQGEILVNPLHLAALYTAFLNEGNVIKPYLQYEEKKQGEVWIENAFSKETVDSVLEGLVGVVNHVDGTAYSACREDTQLAGKTGTAELKVSKEDATGTEIGWFCAFTTDKNVENPVLIVSMVEDVKHIGGSGYVVRKVSDVLDGYLEGE